MNMWFVRKKPKFYNGKSKATLTNGARLTGCWHVEECNNPYLSFCTKLNSKWIKYINIKSDTLNMIEEKVGNSLEHTGKGDNFLNRTPMDQLLRLTIDKWTSWNWKASVRQRIPPIGQMATYWMGKDLHQPHIWPRANIQNI